MTPRQIALGADALIGLVIVSVAAALGSLVWHVVMPPKEARAIVTRGRAASPAEVDIAPVLRLAPFGTAAARADSDEEGGALALRGILLVQPATLSTALIGGAAGAAKPYRLGDRLPDGSTLTGIAAQSVTLRGSGGDVRLGFPRHGTSPSSSPAEEASASDSIVIPEAATEPSPSPSARPAASGVAAIRALIPPSVSGIRPPSAPPPDRAGPTPPPG